MLNIPNSKPPPNSEEPLTFVVVGDDAFPLKNIHYDLAWDFQSRMMRASKFITRLTRVCRVVDNGVGILNQKFRFFYDRIQLRSENADKVVLAACVLHSYLSNDVSLEDCVMDNTDAP